MLRKTSLENRRNTHLITYANRSLPISFAGGRTTQPRTRQQGSNILDTHAEPNRQWKRLQLLKSSLA